jgi:hypothetical protein
MHTRWLSASETLQLDALRGALVEALKTSSLSIWNCMYDGAVQEELRKLPPALLVEVMLALYAVLLRGTGSRAFKSAHTTTCS